MATKEDMAVNELLEGAWVMYDDAVRLYESGDIRDAAEKAWCATIKSSNALIAEYTNYVPTIPTQTRRRLDALRVEDEWVRERDLMRRYYERQDFLHGDCFYDGVCEPRGEIERRIRETDRYILDIEFLIRSHSSLVA